MPWVSCSLGEAGSGTRPVSTWGSQPVSQLSGRSRCVGARPHCEPCDRDGRPAARHPALLAPPHLDARHDAPGCQLGHQGLGVRASLKQRLFVQDLRRGWGGGSSKHRECLGIGRWAVGRCRPLG
jgi:hypothetical protein